MGSRFMNRSIFLCEQDDSKNSPENSGDSPRSTMLINNDTKMTCTSSPKRSRRSIQKRVVSVPIKDVEGSRLKGEMGAPPSDSWAWRKYGQKPIKGSPYPRGYYRCSSSKGCPARKQVERSRADPTMLVVTYSCEHNHPWPAASRNNNNHHHHQQNHNAAVASASRRKTTIQTPPTNSEEEQEQEDEEEEEEEGDHQKPTNIAPKEEVMINNCDDQNFSNLGEASLSEYGCNWFSDLECTSSTTMLESPILLSEDRVTDDDMAMVFTMPDEDESFFADLGELPECSTVFRRGMMNHHHRRHNLASWCGTTG